MLTAVLKAAVKKEELDVTDQEVRVEQTKKLDILRACSSLKMASEIHLGAFVRRFKMQGINYKPVMMNINEFKKIIVTEDNKGGMGRSWD